MWDPSARKDPHLTECLWLRWPGQPLPLQEGLRCGSLGHGRLGKHEKGGHGKKGQRHPGSTGLSFSSFPTKRPRDSQTGVR